MHRNEPAISCRLLTQPSLGEHYARSPGVMSNLITRDRMARELLLGPPSGKYISQLLDNGRE